MSRQQDAYLLARRNGHGLSIAAEIAGISTAEARLIDEAIERHEIQIPAAGNAASSEGGPKMARRAKADEGNRGVTNLSNCKDLIKTGVPKILNIEEKIAALRQEKNAIRENINAAGVPKAAFDHALKTFKMDLDDRARFDEGVAITRDAMSLPLSRSLFDMIEEPTGAAPADDADDESNGNANDQTDALAA